jgi:hypothetical protein
LRLFECRFAPAEVSFLRRKLVLELPSRLSDKWGCEGFGQLDFGMAVRADDLGFGHGVGPVHVGTECSGIREIA